jgi:hypothetical protein
MYLELYIYFTNNTIILFTLDDPDKDIHTFNLIKHNLILYKPKCTEKDIFIVADEIKKTYDLKQIENNPNYNILHYHQIITLKTNENMIDKFLQSKTN